MCVEAGYILGSICAVFIIVIALELGISEPLTFLVQILIGFFKIIIEKNDGYINKSKKKNQT